MSEAIDPAKAAAALMQALSSTFAEMAFIDVEPVAPGRAGPDRFSAKATSFVRAAIDVLRPVSCRIEIECQASLKERIEATLFQERRDEAPGEDEKNREDSLLEILNVISGVFLTAYFGPGPDIKLELPQYLYFSDGSEGAILAEAAADAEGDPIRAVLRSIRYRY
jgi:hypothetical protein